MDFINGGKLLRYLKISSQLYILYISLLYFTTGGHVEKPASWIDLTHPFRNDTIFFPGVTNFTMDVKHRGKTSDGIWFETNSIALGEHGGTHCDAPSHFAEGNLRMHQLPIERFHSEAVVIDISQQAAADSDIQLTLEDVIQFEKLHGRIPPGAFVFMHSGWDRKWPNIGQVLGNEANYSELHFPGIHPELAAWLVGHRDIGAVGVDTPSIDHGPSSHFQAHRILYKENIFGMENVNHLGELPPTGSIVYAFPMNIHDGSGAPCRIMAAIPGSVLSSLNTWCSFTIFLVSVIIVFSF